MIFCKDRQLTIEECILLGFIPSCRQCFDVLDADQIKNYTRFETTLPSNLIYFCSSKCYIDWAHEINQDRRRSRRRFYVATR